MSVWESNQEIQIFREYLQIPSVQPNVDYGPCVEFLCRQAANLDLITNIYHPGHPKKPVVILTWTGTQPKLPTIVLNSHMDVVPVYEENWSHPPFAAEVDDMGRIYGRGTQDMKCVGAQYLGAIRALKKKGIQLKRTLHVIFVPDEEIGGKLGMKVFVPSESFKALNVGFALDEGIASETEVFPVYYAERTIYHIFFKISGTPGHGSLLHKNTAGEKLRYLLDKFMDFRKLEVLKLEKDSSLTIGDVTTINLTMVEGGVQSNVVPPFFTICMDVRLAIDVDLEAFEKQIKIWCDEAGGDISIEYAQKEDYIPPTYLEDTNEYWRVFKRTIDDLGLKIKTQVFPGGTDSRFIRKANIPAIGFSPMNYTPVRLHDHDEFIKVDTYLKGIEIYEKLILNLANI